MIARRLDSLARALASPCGRRPFVAALALLALPRCEALAAPSADRRRRCRPACPPERIRQHRACVCREGVSCGDACCLPPAGCVNGQCVSPRPECIPAGSPCKGAGQRCCAGLACGSGQGGMHDVACYVPKGGRCTATAECTYGTSCLKGTCRPAPVPPVCRELGQTCAPGRDACCAGTCRPSEVAGQDACCLAASAACTPETAGACCGGGCAQEECCVVAGGACTGVYPDGDWCCDGLCTNGRCAS